MVGTCIYVAEGKLTLDEVKESLATGKELRIRYKADPQGLILEQINYPQFENTQATPSVLLF